MGFREALRICPKAIVVPGHIRALRRFCRARAAHPRNVHARGGNRRSGRFLPRLCRHPSGCIRITKLRCGRLQARDTRPTGLSVSVGAARTKSCRLHSFTAGAPARLPHGRARRRGKFLTRLPWRKLHGIGHVHAGALAERGIARLGNCARCPSPRCRPPSANPSASKIWERAPRPRWPRSAAPSTPKSVSQRTTIEGGTIDTDFLSGLIEYLSERIG